MPTHEEDAERWRALAEEAWAAANEVTDPEARRVLVFIATAYERLAERGKKRKGDGN
jgi:hypothetical protein